MEDGNIGIFRPEANAKRLNHSARRMFMPEFPEEWFMDGIKALVDIDREWAPQSTRSFALSTSFHVRELGICSGPSIRKVHVLHYYVSGWTLLCRKRQG